MRWPGCPGADQRQWPCSGWPRSAVVGIPLAEPPGGPGGDGKPGGSTAALALLRLTDGLLPDRRDNRPSQSWRQLLRQAFTLALLELLLVLGGLGLIQSLSWMLGRWSTALAGLSVVAGGLILLSWLFSQVMALPLLVHERCRALQAMDLSRQLVHRNGFKVLALLGMLLGINLLGLIGATLGLLISLPFSALVLMACCRPQTPLSNDSRRNMFPT